MTEPTHRRRSFQLAGGISGAMLFQKQPGRDLQFLFRLFCQSIKVKAEEYHIPVQTYNEKTPSARTVV